MSSSPLAPLLRPVVRPVRRTLAAGLQAKVGGPGAAETAARIWDTPGERWFHDGDPVWRVHADASMFAGGVRALLLQSLHPLAMYGVAEFSGYRDDPWARVASTSAYIAQTTYATVEDARAAVDKVRRIHRHVRGTAPDGRPYAADDPELLRWVHVAEIDSFLVTYQALSRHPLTAREADTYVAQAGVPAELLGVVDPPQSVAELAAAIESFRPDLALTPPAVDAISLVLREPPLAWWGRPFYDAIAGAAVATLPDWAREMVGAKRRPGAILAGKGVLGGVGWVMQTPADT